MKRELTPGEKMLITRAAEKLDATRGAQLMADMQKATAESVAVDGSRVIFDISDYKRPPYRGQHPFPVEMRMRDGDGAEISVLLHADENDRLYELEMIRWENGRLICPNWESLELW